MGKGITVKKTDNFSEWYTQVIQKAELMEYTNVSGCMVIRPYAYEIWESAQKFFDEQIKKLGVKNCYFPMLIPESLLTKEADHIEGFTPEVAWVTHGGSTKMAEKLAIRPTSETIINDTFRKWIRSYNDLPVKINQWCNIVRWEFKHPVPFLRTREFLWQEGHTAHATKEEMDEMVMDALEAYRATFEELYAIPMLLGKKSEKEKFAGADYTVSAETLFSDGKAIQAATSHGLGQNFAKAFEISFTNDKEQQVMPFQTSWGFSTRSLGMLFGIHGDDKGLILPPKMAPIQVVVIPIIFDDSKKKVLDKCNSITKSLSDFKVEMDAREQYSPGWKYNQWEMKGVPIRIEVGPKDLEQGHAMVARRDTGEKEAVKFDKIQSHVAKLLEDIQTNMYNMAKRKLDASVVKVKDFKEFKQVLKDKKLALAPWCATVSCEEKLKEKTNGAKSINIPFDSKKPKEPCVVCNKEATVYARLGKSY